MIPWLKRILGSKQAVPPTPAPASPAARSSTSAPRAGNPAKGAQFNLHVSGPAGERSEEIDLVQLLGQAFKQLGRTVETNQVAVVDRESGIEFRPGIVEFQPKDDLSMNLCTTLEVRHATAFSVPFFDYQHSHGETGELSARQGFQQWAELDLPVILDATQAELKHCTALVITPKDGKRRRVVLGPVWRACPNEADAGAAGAGEAESHPPLCRCCFFTNSMETFMPLVESDTLCAVRLFAARDTNGAAMADCRVNGEDFPDGIRALRQYVGKWISVGFDARKQYVIIQDHPG